MMQGLRTTKAVPPPEIAVFFVEGRMKRVYFDDEAGEV
jgi:hypothetical protein